MLSWREISRLSADKITSVMQMNHCLQPCTSVRTKAVLCFGYKHDKYYTLFNVTLWTFKCKGLGVHCERQFVYISQRKNMICMCVQAGLHFCLYLCACVCVCVCVVVCLSVLTCIYVGWSHITRKLACGHSDRYLHPVSTSLFELKSCFSKWNTGEWIE